MQLHALVPIRATNSPFRLRAAARSLREPQQAPAILMLEQSLLEIESAGGLELSGVGLPTDKLMCDAGAPPAGAGDDEALRAFSTWGPRAREALDRACDALAPGLRESGVTLVLRPDARQILPDVPSVLAFLRKRSDQPFEVILDPMALLTESMVERAEDHLARALDAAAGHPGVPMLLLTNVRSVEGGGLEPSPVNHGLIDPRLILKLVRASWPEHKPILLPARSEAELHAQFDLLMTG
jgi:hypothetical protein